MSARLALANLENLIACGRSKFHGTAFLQIEVCIYGFLSHGRQRADMIRPSLQLHVLIRFVKSVLLDAPAFTAVQNESCCTACRVLG